MKESFTKKVVISHIAFFLLSLIQQTSSNVVPRNESKRMTCYYTFPSFDYSLQPRDLNSRLCTHILVGFATLSNCSIAVSEDQKEIIREVVLLKKKNAQLKVMLSIGGGGGTFGFPEMVKSSTNRSRFIKSLETTIENLDLDGIDLDWEFPNDWWKNERRNFIYLLEDIRQNIDNSIRKYLLSIAVAAPITIVSASYDIPAINRLVDFVNLMSYDYNFFSLLTPWTGMNSPLYARSTDFFYFATQNINYTSNYWLKKGLTKEKLNIGLPVYAHTYRLASSNRTYLGAPSIGDGVLGGGGSASYGTVCDFMQRQKLTPVFDEETRSPYVTNGTEWVSFENDESMNHKAQFVRDNDFGGVMVYSLSSDDYEGKCKKGLKFPNTKMIHEIFFK